MSDVSHALNAALGQGLSADNPQPPPELCQCGALVTYRLFPPAGSRHRLPSGRQIWTRGPANPCADCIEQAEKAEAERRIRRQQRAAGIGERDRHWRWDCTEVQRLDGEHNEPLGSFQQRVRQLGRPTLGVLRYHRAAAFDLANWTPDSGHSIYLFGAQGTGKTAYVSALATRLLAGKPLTMETFVEDCLPDCWDGYDPARLVRARRNVIGMGGRHWRVLLISHSELYERVKLGWQRDKAPLAKVVDTPGLILDDLGEVGSDPLGNGRQPPGAAEGVQRLIRERYVRARNLVITSNIPFKPVYREGRKVLSGIEDWYGARVYGRLKEMTGYQDQQNTGHVYSLGGASWR